MKRKKIVTIGGGTGSFTLLSGLKKYAVDLSAIVSMADDGGSTGVLRDELGVLPPGDVRQCLVALSDSPEMLRTLMNYRFDKGGLKGHTFGNLFLSALEKINKSFTVGVEQAIKILDVEGEVLPVSDKAMRLHIELNNGKILVGEKNLDHNEEIRNLGIKKVFLKPQVYAYKKVLDRIKAADVIVIGPGDLYGSILPIFLVKEIGAEIKKSKAKVIFNCNITNKKGQTENFTIDDYVEIIEGYIGKGRIDFVTFNNNKIPDSLVKKYEKREGKGSVIIFEKSQKEERIYKIVMADLLRQEKIIQGKGDFISGTRSFIRHDSDKLAKILMMILELGEYENIIKEII
jgi:uncharacterized cofD-like protein